MLLGSMTTRLTQRLTYLLPPDLMLQVTRCHQCDTSQTEPEADQEPLTFVLTRCSIESLSVESTAVSVSAKSEQRRSVNGTNSC